MANGTICLKPRSCTSGPSKKPKNRPNVSKNRRDNHSWPATNYYIVHFDFTYSDNWKPSTGVLSARAVFAKSTGKNKVVTPLRLILVTPETTLLDEPVESLQFPLYDGQVGVLPGRAPMVGRLGYGELRISTAAGIRSFYIDGGFVQVQGPVVSLLTNRSMPTGEINIGEAEELLEKTSRQVPTSDAEFAAKDRDQQRSRRMIALAKSVG